MHVFAAVVMALILSGFMGIKHIYATAVNPSILTVMALIALTGVLKKTLPFHRIGDLLGKSSKGFMIRTGLVTAALSGFINNTPVVALLIPILKSKAKEHNWPIGNYLMPLSFAAVAGGTITLIGTSTLPGPFYLLTYSLLPQYSKKLLKAQTRLKMKSVSTQLNLRSYLEVLWKVKP